MLRLIRKKKGENISFTPEQAIILPIESSSRSLDYLIGLIKKIRPSNSSEFAEAELKFKALLFQLSEDPATVASLRKALLSQFIHSNLESALTDSGILSNRSFLPELISRLKHKVLPPLHEQEDFLHVINRVFYKRDDHIWVTGIDQQLWVKLFQILGVSISLNEPALRWQLQNSLQVLSFRIAALGLENELSRRYNGVEDVIQPFLDQNHWINELLNSGSQHTNEVIISNVEECLYNCMESLQWFRIQRKDYGTSLEQTYLVTRLQQQIDRLLIILHVLYAENDFKVNRLVDYFITVIKNENTKSSVRSFISQNLGLLAYQIAEHKDRIGEKYITHSRKDLRQLFLSALAGGFFVSFIAFFRILLSFLRMAPFWQGMVFSSNYSFGFLLMDRAGANLSSTQPAYTASSIAVSADTKDPGGKHGLLSLTRTVARACRTQIASVTGNLIMVVPVSYGLSWVYKLVTLHAITGPAASLQLLEDQHPFHSPALIFAFLTGIAIFLSGLASGYVENYVKYASIAERLQQHPVLQHSLSRRNLNRVVQFIRKNSGTLSGSIILGFFFGLASPLGRILSIPFDFRHITISAANATIGFFGSGHHLALGYILVILLGILLIGIVNFTVSFSLAFIVALKSRGIPFREYPRFLAILGKYFLRHPADFVRSPAKDNSIPRI